MPVPTQIQELSQTAGSNYPQGTDSPSTLDDVQRAIASFIALLRDSKGLTSVKTLASAGTVDIGGADSYAVEIAGTTAITSFGTNYSGPRNIRFTGALTLTHNASLLNLPGAANITTAAGDSCVAVPNSTGNGWNVTSYQYGGYAPNSGANLVGTAAGLSIGGSAAALSASATATTQANSDRSTKVATTQWVQDAMSSIATTAGFAALFAATGYVKFPSWLGGLVVQWGGSASVNGVLSFPLTFPTACYSVAVSGGNGGSYIASAGAFTTTGFDAYGFFPNNGRGAASVSYIAIGN